MSHGFVVMHHESDAASNGTPSPLNVAELGSVSI